MRDHDALERGQGSPPQQLIAHLSLAFDDSALDGKRDVRLVAREAHHHMLWAKRMQTIHPQSKDFYRDSVKRMRRKVREHMKAARKYRKNGQ